MKRIFFFATKRDILMVTNEVERKLAVTYVLEHHDLYPEYGDHAPKFDSAARIPTLGIATRKQTIACERYIVSEESMHVAPISRLVGEKHVTTYEMGSCPDSISFNSGGMWNDRVLINGLVKTWSDSGSAQRLMRSFYSSIKKNFIRKVGSYWVGPDAYQFLEDGGRLTLNVDADSSFDLKISV